MSLEDIHAIERSKWDEIAELEMQRITQELPWADLADYARVSPGLVGVAAFVGDLRGRQVLEYGCGMGRLTAILARCGADVSAFDLSPRSVEVTRARLAAHGLSGAVQEAAGEELPYPDGRFDVVIGESVLHHLDATLGAPELHRIVKPGGRAAFGEPMGMNPLLRFAREHIPYRHKAPRGADVPLSYDDIHQWGERFARLDYREIQLISMLERLWGYEKQIALLRRADEKLLRYKALRRYCRYVAIYMVK